MKLLTDLNSWIFKHFVAFMVKGWADFNLKYNATKSVNIFRKFVHTRGFINNLVQANNVRTNILT